MAPPLPHNIPADKVDQVIADLRNARERLCRASVYVGARHRAEALDRAVREIDAVGCILPGWSTYAMPPLPEL